MLRFLLVLVFIGIVANLILKLIGYFLRKHLLANLNASSATRTEKTVTDETLIRCHFCQIYFPRSQAYVAQNRYYCCQEHSRHE